MSGRVQKAIRKQARKELEELRKNMKPTQQPQQQINILEELNQLLFSLELLTGEKPESLTLTDVMYNMYVQTAQNNAEALGLNPGFKASEPMFRNVKLLKKSPLIVPPSPLLETPAN